MYNGAVNVYLSLNLKMCIIRDRSLFKCQGGWLKVGGVHVNFHVTSRGVTINFDFPAGGGGGSCLNCYNKIIKNFPRSLSFY